MKWGGVTQIRMPGGALCFEHDDRFSSNYHLCDGKVYQNDISNQQLQTLPGKAGGLHPDVPLSGFEVIENYPLKDLYPTFKQFVETYYEESFNEKEGAYGYYRNPDAKWDWWQIGGRWKNVFLVPESVDLSIPGSVFESQEVNASSGCRWVFGARKSDIQWTKMHKLFLDIHRDAFQKLKKWFFKGIEPEGKSPTMFKREDGIYKLYDLVYIKSDTLNDYIQRVGVNPGIRFPCNTYAFIDATGWHGFGDMGWFGIDNNKKDNACWNDEVDAFIASVPDDHFLVSVVCHI